MHAFHVTQLRRKRNKLFPAEVGARGKHVRRREGLNLKASGLSDPGKVLGQRRAARSRPALSAESRGVRVRPMAPQPLQGCAVFLEPAHAIDT